MSTWMVVEDEPDIYEVLLAMFEMWGIEGVAFVDGEEAVRWIDDVEKGRFTGELPEMALLDIRLPDSISGPMVGERLRKCPQLANMAIVLITAFKLSADEEKAVMEQAGADKLIYKPLPKFNQLKQILEDVLAKRRVMVAPAAESAPENPPPPPSAPATPKPAPAPKSPSASGSSGKSPVKPSGKAPSARNDDA